MTNISRLSMLNSLNTLPGLLRSSLGLSLALGPLGCARWMGVGMCIVSIKRILVPIYRSLYCMASTNTAQATNKMAFPQSFGQIGYYPELLPLPGRQSALPNPSLKIHSLFLCLCEVCSFCEWRQGLSTFELGISRFYLIWGVFPFGFLGRSWDLLPGNIPWRF